MKFGLKVTYEFIVLEAALRGTNARLGPCREPEAARVATGDRGCRGSKLACLLLTNSRESRATALGSKVEHARRHGAHSTRLVALMTDSRAASACEVSVGRSVPGGCLIMRCMGARSARDRPTTRKSGRGRFGPSSRGSLASARRGGCEYTHGNAFLTYGRFLEILTFTTQRAVIIVDCTCSRAPLELIIASRQELAVRVRECSP